jgi:tetratricopeptide (TPR) repeat protein
MLKNSARSLQEKVPIWFTPIGIMLVIFLAFLPILKGDYVNWDDEQHLLLDDNIRALTFTNLVQIFTQTVNDTYIPLTTLSFALEHHLFGFQAWIFHFDNLLLHLLVVGFIYLFGRMIGMSKQASGIGALIFGIHPMHVESVAWITERKDVLYSALYMGSVLAYLRYIRYHSLIFFGMSLILCLLSILAKSMALSLPLILGVCDWFVGRKYSRRLILEKLPFFCIVVPVAAITYALHARVPIQDLGQGLLIWIWSFTFYISKFFLPIHLSTLYPLPVPVSITSAVYLLAVMLLILILMIFLRYHQNRWLTFAGLFYFFSIFFLLRFDSGHDVNPVADRFMYLPSVGICLALGVGIDRIQQLVSKKKKLMQTAVYTTMGVSLFLLFVQTFRQAGIWQNGILLWSQTIRYYPSELTAYIKRAESYILSGAYDLAEADYHLASQIISVQADQFLAEAHQYLQKGSPKKALKELEKALFLSPHHKAAQDLQITIFEQFSNRQQDHTDFKYWDHILNQNPHQIEAFINRGLLFQQKGQYASALTDYDQVIRLAPNNPVPYFNRSTVFIAQQKFQDALNDLNQVILLDHNFLPAYINRAEILINQGDDLLALADVRYVLLKDPQAQVMKEKEAKIYFHQGKFEQALKICETLMKEDPLRGDITLLQSQIHAKQGNLEKAFSQALKARLLGTEVDQDYLNELKTILKHQQTKFCIANP